jgi:hypothetical protein
MVAEEESISPPFLYGRRRRIYISSIPHIGMEEI